ncbi:hypothetical protein F511_20497 [Dorcoceras hygrometricum]|uniref:Uncharacterized protein n=1 Tax=Dorcoceras hygrometricum TaxID=472368 RepID=A0A2Z7ACA1_9LAMI|nr:hypothetical protein F511_20497 [Dorcoceras hygrometricum]
MKRRRAEESADGLALMTSSVTSSYSADGLREQSQESAGSLYIQTQERSDVVEEAIQSQATVHQHIASIAKRCRLHKLIRQRFALELKIQQMLFALINQSQDTSWKHMFKIPAGQPDASNSSLQSKILNGKNVVSNGINLYRGYICEGDAIEGGRRERLVLETTLVQLQYCGRNTLITQCTNRGKNKKKDEAIDRH